MNRQYGSAVKLISNSGVFTYWPATRLRTVGITTGPAMVKFALHAALGRPTLPTRSL